MQMISRSIYIYSKNESLEYILDDLGITRDNIASYGQGARHLKIKKNGAFVEPVQGDFTHAVDFDLFDRKLPDVIESFEKISGRGINIAMPDEDDADPEIFHLWRDGKKFLIRIIEDDEKNILILDSLGKAGLQ